MTLSGIGYDVHSLIEGRPLVLGGVTIPHPKGLDGHSDADVLAHAIADAMLGAIAAGDIGHHFPNTDESIRGINSLEILARAAALLEAAGARLIHLDATVIAEAPRIAPHLPAMRLALAAAVGLPLGRVSVKATTNETLGFLGRGEGIAALAIASVEQPGDDTPAGAMPVAL